MWAALGICLPAALDFRGMREEHRAGEWAGRRRSDRPPLLCSFIPLSLSFFRPVGERERERRVRRQRSLRERRAAGGGEALLADNVFKPLVLYCWGFSFLFFSFASFSAFVERSPPNVLFVRLAFRAKAG